MAEELSLIDFWTAPYGMRVRIALEEKGIQYQFIKEDLSTLDKSPLLLKMNPIHKKIPVLIHGGRPICESLIILQYIDEVWNETSPLLPQDPQQRAHARFWADFVDKKVYECVTNMWKKKGEALEAAKKEFIETFKLMEGAMGDDLFLGGETFGFLDIALIPFTAFFNTCEIFGNFTIEPELPKIVAWAKRCNERESVSKVLPNPPKAYEVICLARKLQGIE
ncbi:probable glutathione S-transferase parC [Macadamia integrifolia]|uniref:probable glutathione S-transferase parC n=1 Tax=Macadamia integrifolia TaxID=60698 RepID=UPI001C53290B|nr:probable glutathione S-transferase parC [Macadamia integrifolia]